MRTLSFALGLIASLTLMLFPFLLHDIPGMQLHTGLPIMMLGFTGTLVYGIGYIPSNRVLRIFFGPVCAWSLIVFGSLILTA